MQRYFYYIYDTHEANKLITPKKVKNNLLQPKPHNLHTVHCRPVITVCLLINNDGAISRGVSFCSTKKPERGKRDNIKKRHGKSDSTYRAMNALLSGENTEAFRVGNKRLKYFGKNLHADIKSITENLSAFNPKLTTLEQKLIYGDKAINYVNDHINDILNTSLGTGSNGTGGETAIDEALPDHDGTDNKAQSSFRLEFGSK